MKALRALARPRRRRGAAALVSLVTMVSLACALGAGCGLLPSEPVSLGSLSLKIPPQAPPATVTVRRGTVASTVQIAGQVTSTRQALLYFRVAGRLSTLNVRDGETVAAGQVLATLDSGDLVDQIRSARLTVAGDRVTLDSLRLQDRTSPPRDAVAAQEQAVALQQAELALRHDTQGLQQLQHTYDQTRIVAPFAGQVSEIANSPGDQVAAFAAVMQVSDPQHEALIADIDSETAAHLHRGQAVDVTLNGARRQHLHGTIVGLNVPSEAEIMRVEENTNGNVVLTPTVTVGVPVRGALPIGETFSGLIILGKATDVLYLPSDVIRRLSGRSYVDVYHGGVVSQIAVTVGLQGDTTTAVLSGLKAGQRVVQP